VVALAPIPGAVNNKGESLFLRGISVLHCYLNKTLKQWAPQKTHGHSSACPSSEQPQALVSWTGLKQELQEGCGGVMTGPWGA